MLAKVPSVVSVFVAPILIPVLIWVAFPIAIRELLLRWHESRLPRVMACRIDTDCRPGYICIGGRCVPQY
jgi:hypothetical protein